MQMELTYQEAGKPFLPKAYDGDEGLISFTLGRMEEGIMEKLIEQRLRVTGSDTWGTWGDFTKDGGGRSYHGGRRARPPRARIGARASASAAHGPRVVATRRRRGGGSTSRGARRCPHFLRSTPVVTPVPRRTSKKITRTTRTHPTSSPTTDDHARGTRRHRR